MKLIIKAVYNYCYYLIGPDTRVHSSEEWTDLVDRGGLIHISDTIFSFFAAMEMVVKSHYQAENPLLLKGLKESITTGVLENGDVLLLVHHIFELG